MKQRLTILIKEIDINSKEVSDLIDLINNSEDDFVKELFFPQDKLLWEKCSTILNLIKFEKILPYFGLILEWFQDLNWPGITNIVKLLEAHKSEIDFKIIDKTIILAYEDNDEMWLGGLKFLVKKLDCADKGYLSEDSLNYLKTVDWI